MERISSNGKYIYYEDNTNKTYFIFGKGNPLKEYAIQKFLETEGNTKFFIEKYLINEKENLNGGDIYSWMQNCTICHYQYKDNFFILIDSISNINEWESEDEHFIGSLDEKLRKIIELENNAIIPTKI